MESSIIIIDSDDDESQNQINVVKEVNNVQQSTSACAKRSNETIKNGNSDPIPAKIRRIQPQKIGEVSKCNDHNYERSNENDPFVTPTTSKESLSLSSVLTSTISDISVSDKNSEKEEGAVGGQIEDKEDGDNKEKVKQEHEITKELKGFIKACRTAESNDDMKKIIKSKLLKNYHLVNSKYVLSNFFRKMLEDTALAILKDPKSVYSKLQDIINELKSRRNSSTLEVVNVEPSIPSEELSVELVSASTGDDKKDSRLRRLNKALTNLKKEIEILEEEEVNWSDEDNAYTKKTKYERRAVQIYNKICEITGESSHAHRIVKQPVKFKNTRFQEFNKKLTKKVNKENGFPNYYDVFRILDYCNKEYKYGMGNKELNRVAEDAFQDVGKLLKERRRNDLYESATHYAGKNKDPAKEDPDLKSKLENNKEFYRKKTEDLLEFYVNKQTNGETGDVEMMDGCEPSTSAASNMKIEKSPVVDVDDDEDEQNLLRYLPTEKLMSIIDVKAEKLTEDCDMVNGDKKDPSIDLTLSF